MKGFLKEIPWILISSALGMSAAMAIGINVFTGDTALDLNVHDTYFVLDTYEGVLFFISFFIFITFIFRLYKSKMKNFNAFLIIVFSGVALIMVIDEVISFLGLLRSPLDQFANPESNEAGWTVYPPLSTIEQKSNLTWRNLETALKIPQILIITILVYLGYKTGQKNKLQNKEL